MGAEAAALLGGVREGFLEIGGSGLDLFKKCSDEPHIYAGQSVLLGQ